jgi:GntR family carbon starvation induced transcriptional regulator
METTESLSHAERAYRRLRSEILYGDLMPGERLRAAELQDRFSLGLTPIREALMRLSSENLVEVDPNRGSRVSDASLAELADLMATRREIEKLCLTSAMTHGDTAWEGDIVAALHRLSRTPLPSSKDDREAATQWEAQHRSFHFALVSACQEKWLLRFWNILTDHSERYRKYRLLQPQEQPAVAPLRNVNEEHQALMEAVLKRDIPTATRLMQAHLNATEQSVAKLLRQAMPSTKDTKENP